MLLMQIRQLYRGDTWIGLRLPPGKRTSQCWPTVIGKALDDVEPETCKQLDVLAALVQRVRDWVLDLLLLLAATQCALQSSWTQPNSAEARERG